MKYASTSALALATACIGCTEPSLAGPQAHAPVRPSAAASAPADAATQHTLCRPQETVIFSCRIRGSRKLASLCGAADFGTNPDAYAYYAFGAPAAVELKYPDEAAPAKDTFTRTHLGFAGATGGYAYGFSNAGFGYYVYAISGTGFEDQGVLVTRSGAARRDLKCDPHTVEESAAHGVVDAELAWPQDPDVAEHGLP